MALVLIFLSLDIGGVCTLPQGTCFAKLWFNYLNNFTQSKLIHVIMPTCIFITITQDCGHVSTHLTNGVPWEGALNHYNVLLDYHRLSNLEYSYLGNSQYMLSIVMVPSWLFLRTYYARYIMAPSITKQCTLACVFFSKVLG